MPDPNNSTLGNNQYIKPDNTYLNKKTIDYLQGKETSITPRQLIDAGQSQYDKGFIIPETMPGVSPYTALADWRGEQQGRLDKWANAVPRLVSKVGTEVLKTPGYLYAGLAAMGDQTLAQTLDNAWLNNLDSVNEAVKEQFAIYKPKAVREGNLWDNITSASFYTDEGVDGAGFLISMAFPSMALKGLNIAGKVAKLGAASKLAGAFGTTSKAIGAGVELGAATTINTALEAMAEAKGVSDELNATLQGQVNPNTGFQYTQEEIDALRGEAAVGTFRTNLGILLIPNLIFNKILLNRYAGTKNAFNSVVSETGELIAQNPEAKQSLLKAYLKNIGKNTISEGFFEEGLQDATTNYYKDKVTGKTDADWLSGIIDAYGDTIGSTEGQKAIFLGGLLGGGMSVIGTRRELKGEQEYKNSLVKMLQNNFTGFANAQDIFEKDENGNIKVETNPETGEVKPVYNMEKATEFLKMTTDAIEKSNKQDLAAFLGDKDEYDRQYLENFIAYAMPYLNVEHGIEAVNRQIDNMSKEVIDKTKQTSDMFDSTFDETQFKEDLKQKVKEVAKQQVGIQNQMDTVYNTIPKDNPELAKAFVNQLGNAATIEVTNQIFYNSKIRELSNEISQMETSINANLPQNQAIINNLVKKRDEYQKSLDESIKNYSEIFDKNKVLGAFEEYKTIKDKLKDIINKIQSGEVTDLNELTKTDEQKHEEALDKFYKAQDINELNDAVEALKQSPLLTEELANKLNEEYDKAVESFARKDQIDQIINRKEEVYNSLTDQIKQARESIEEKEVEAEILQEDYTSGKLKISEKNLAKKINEINDAIKQLEDFIANAETQRDQILAEVDYYGTEAAIDMEAVEANRDAKRRTIEDINKRIEETKTLLDRLKDLLKGMTAVWNKVFPNKKVNLEKGRWEYIDAKSQIDAKKSEITEVNNLLAELEDIKAELTKQEEALTSELEEFKQITSKYYKGREVVDTTIDETTNNPDDVEIDEQPKAFDPKSIKSINIAFGSTAGNNMIGETDKVTNDPDQLRWFRYTSQLKFNKNLSAYNLMAVTSKNNPYGDKVKFKDTEKGEDIVLILHKDGQPVVIDGELVYTSMWGNWTLEQAKTRFSNPSKMSDADMQRLLDNHKKLRESIIAGTKPTMLPATGLTPGIRVIDNTKDTEGKFIYKFPVSGRIVDSNDQIDTIEMEVATTNTVTVGNYQVDAVPGMVYVKVNGQVVPMRVAKIGEIDGAVEKIVKLITQLRDVTSPKFTGDRTQEFKRIYDEINKVILFANTKEDSKYKIFMAKDGRLYYNGKYHTAINLEDLQNFLANKYFRVSNKLLKANQKSFKDPISGKTWPSYKHYLMSNEGRADNQVPVGTDLVGNTNQQFLNVGISYLSRPETTKKTNEFGSGLAVEISPRKTTTVDDEEFGPIPGEGLQRLPGEISPRATTQKPTGPIAPGTKFTKGGSEITITKSDQYKVEFTTSTGAKQSMRLNDFNAAIQKGSIKAIGAPIGTGLAAEVSPRAKAGTTPTTDTKADIERRRKLSGWNASYELATIAKTEGVDLSKLSREEYANYAIKNGLKIDDSQLRANPKHRNATTVQEVVEMIKADRASLSDSIKKAFDSFYQEMMAIVDKSQTERYLAQNIRLLSGTKNSNSWLFFSINNGTNDKETTTHKSYFSLKNLNDFSPKVFKDFMIELQKRGYNGGVKIFQDLETQGPALSDQVVMHGYSENDAKLALQVAKEFYGDKILESSYGKDEVINGKSMSYSQILSNKINDRVDSGNTQPLEETSTTPAAIEGAKPATKSRILFTQEHDEAIKEAEAIEDQITQESASTQSLVDKLNSLQSDDTGEDFPGLEREHYRLFIGEEAATQAELDAEEKWFRSNFPEIDYTRVKNLIDGKAVGKFLGSGRILISQLAAKGTTYHEAFHVVSQLFFTEKERQALYKEYSNRTGKELTDDQAEEGLAEDFRAYMIGERLSFSPKQKSLFRRLLDAIKSLLGIGQPNIEEIFEKIKKGAYKSSKPLVDKNNGAKNYYSEVPGKDTQWTRDFMESTTVFFFKHLMKGNQDWSIENLFDTSNKAFIGNIYERVKNDFIETYKKLPKEFQETLAQDYNFILAPTLSQNEQNKRWNMLVKAHAKYLSKFGMEIKFRDNIDEIDPDSNTAGQRDDYEDNIPESERTTKDNTYIDAINFSTKDKMPKSVKLLIASLPKVETREGKPKVIVNRFGTPAGVDFNRTMDWLHNKLANISDLNDMIKTINELSDIKPELKVLLGYLKIDTSNNLPVTLDFDQAKLVVQFWQQFAKTKNTYYTGLIDDAGNFIFADSNSQRFKSKIQSQWANAMKDSANIADGIYTINSDGRIVFNTAKLQKISLFTNTNNIDSVIKFFNELGITFSTDKWNKITDYRQWEEDNKVKGVFKPFSKETADEVSIILNAYAKIKEFVLKNDNIESLFDKGLIRGSMDALAELEGKYNPNITESQHLSPDKKTVYDITLNTYLSNVVNKINRYGIESIDHLNRKNNIYTRGSLFYDLLLAGKKLDLVVLSGMRINEPGEEGELTSDLKAGDFYVQSMNAILGNNIQFIRAADKKLEYAFHIDFDLTNEEFEEQMIRYFYDDIVRSIELVQNGVGADIANYKNNAKRSVLFEGIFKDNAKLAYDASKLKNADAFIRKNREAIVNAIRSWSNEQIKKQIEVFTMRNIIVAKGDKFMIKGIDNTLLTKMFGEDIDTTVDTFTAEEINSIIRNIHNKFTIGAIEQIKLFTGDLAFFKDGSDVSKRTGGLTGPKKLSLIGSAINTFLNTNMKRKDGKQANDKFNVLVYNDVKAISENLDEYKAAIGYKADKYASYDEADAQGLITLDEYREMMFRAGDWTPQQNEAYKKAINGETLTADELALFPPTKPQYYGPRTDNNGKLYIPTYYKLSLMPLIPQALKGTQLEKLNKYMTDNKVGVTMFASANKVGNNTNPNFYKEDGTINLPSKTELSNYLQESEYAYMGIQVDNAPIEKTKVTLGTQFRALILSNLFNNGVGKVISFFNHNTGKVESKDTREIADEYNSIVNEITDIEWNNLLNRLTLTKDNSGNYKISDIEVFKDILISEAEDRAAAYNIVDYIYKSLEGDVKAVDFTLSKGKIENLLYSMVNNKVVKQKVNGDMKVLAASTGFELQARKFKDLPDGTKKILGNDVLKFYTQKGPNGTTTKMQVLLPWYFKEMFKGADLKNIDPKILNLVGVRTPTEGYKNIEAIEVAGFLPREVGNLVITPSEIVVKSGSDYDVDKLTLYIPNSIKIGNKYKYIPTDEKGLKKLYDEWVKNYQDKLKLVKQRIKDIEIKPLLVEDKDITDFRELLASAFSDIAESEKLLQSLINKEKNIESQLNISFDDFKNNLKRKQLENKMIELSLNVLSSPDIFGQLITPTSVDTFEKLAEKISKTLGTEDSKYTTSIIQFLDNAITAQRFWTGKSGVGIIALHNKSHTLAQQSNLSMPDATLYFGKNGKPLYNTTDGTPTGDISLASEYDANGETSGNRISDMLAELLNSYLEVAKNPFILKLNAGVNTANVWSFLLRSGVPVDTLAAFMNQPIIRTYVLQQSVNEAMFKKATQDKFNPVLTKDQLIQKVKLQFQVNKVKVRDEASYELMDDTKLNSMLSKDAKRDNEFYINQLQILDNFLNYQEYSKSLSELQKYTSVDTNGAGKNRNEARASIKGLNTLKVMNTFNGIDEYINNTILKGFYNAVNESQNMYNELFVTDLPKSQEALSNINDYIDSLGFTSDTAAELKNLAENEFISYLLQTVKSDNKFLSQEITRLFNGKNSIANKLLEIKRNKKHPLNNNTVIKELFPVLRGSNMTDIIKRFNRQMNTYEQNIFVDAFKEIYETNPALAMDIVKFGIIQSGLNNSPITFNSLIPADLFFRVADPILLQYITSENIDVNTFSTQFLLNNYTGAAAKLVRKVRATDSKGLRIPLVKKNGSPNFIAKYNVLKTVRNLAKKNETPVWETKLYVKTGGDETTAYYSEAPLLGEGMNIHRYYPSDVFNQIIAHNNPTVTSEKPVVINESDEEYEAMESEETPEIFKVQQPTVSPRTQQGTQVQAFVTPGKLKQEISPRAKAVSTQAGKQEYRLLPDKIKTNLAKAGITEKMFNGLSNQEQQQALKCHG